MGSNPAECPICVEPYSGPIFICQNGHSLCGNCTTLVPQCPTCRAPKPKIRNYGLEAMVAESAQNSQLSTNSEDCFNECQDILNLHNEDYYFRDVTCNACNNLILYQEYIQHLIQVHNVQEQSLGLQIDLDLDKIKSDGEKYVLHNENGENLLVNLMARNGHFYIWIEHLKGIGSSEIVGKYLVQFWIKDQPNFAMSLECPVLDFRSTSKKDILEHHFSFSLKQMENFQRSGSGITSILISSDATKNTDHFDPSETTLMQSIEKVASLSTIRRSLLKPIHVCTTLEELNKLIDSNHNPKNDSQYKSLMATLLTAAEAEYSKGDEEFEYFFHMRYIEVLSQRYKILPIDLIEPVLGRCEELAASLSTRYKLLKAEEEVEVEDVIEAMSVRELKSRLDRKLEEFLFIDVRSTADFNTTRIAYPKVISLPFLSRGMTAGIIKNYLKRAKQDDPNDIRLELWNTRTTVDAIVLLDMEERSPTLGILYRAMVLHDFANSDVVRPKLRVIEGGYKAIQMTYPNLLIFTLPS